MNKGKENLVFFSAPIKGEREKVERIIMKLGNWIKMKGFTIVNEHVVTENPRKSLAEKFGKSLNELTVEEIEQYNTSKLCEAHYVIAEVSGASTGVGREVEFARTKGYFGFPPAKILCLYHKDYENSASPMILGMGKEKYPNVTVASYQNIEEAQYIIKDFLGIKI